MILIEVSMRIEEGQQFAPAQHKPINGVLRGVGDINRVCHQ